ncbi:MAG: folate-binding protein YgfZ [Gammaproteobacteria bacterium]
MELNWKTHLESCGAKIIDDKVINYGNPESELKNSTSSHHAIIADLSHYGLIRISGSEAQSFLQSQFSNDVTLITESQAQLNSYCSPKGRVLAFFNLFLVNNNYYVQLPKPLLSSIFKRLTMFKMRADVELTDVSDSFLCLGLSGIAAETILTNKFKELPESNFGCTSIETDTQNITTIIRISDSKQQALPRFLLFSNQATLISFWQENSESFLPIGSGNWSLLDIQSGIPTITTETVDAFVPQMLNLHLINAVSFTKGCYPGQEIVARTQYLGKLKKRMYLLTSDYNQTLEPGTDLSSENATDDQSKGKIVNSQLNTKGGIDALAVLQINSITEGKITVKSNPEIMFSIMELPYSFEQKN